MARGKSCTQRTLEALKKQGLRCGIVEKFNRFAGPHGIRQDLFNFIDIIALDVKAKVIVGIQSTSGSAHAAHKKKIIEECREAVIDWLTCYGVIELWSWSKRVVKRGKKAKKWVARVETITLEDLNNGKTKRRNKS